MSKKPKNRLDEQIDENLRRVYQTAASEPVPDRFTQLLDQLRKAEGDKPNSEADA
ncbi:NepR family anti-sigma factor [Donghicola sp. XS_ASV15]|uniref:NepR family anti-sigma factor n=1 Tax=Donghicola sp. XS_ASV15 TaxID=3241295 RepID=UPI0035163CBC